MITADRWVQCHLSSGDSRMVISVPVDYRLKVGTEMRLKDAEDSERWWKIEWISQPSSKPNRGWDNNI